MGADPVDGRQLVAIRPYPGGGWSKSAPCPIWCAMTSPDAAIAAGDAWLGKGDNLLLFGPPDQAA